MQFDATGLPTGSLAATAAQSLATVFMDGDHHPSEAKWAAIMNLVHHLELAATGKLDDAVYLSAIPAGQGRPLPFRSSSRP